MPLFLEPNQSFPIVLDCDKEKPKETQPVFFAKSQSMRGQRHIAEVLDSLLSSEKTSGELFTEVVDELEKVLTGWSNMGGHQYCRDSMELVLSYQEARELLRKVLLNQHLQADEKKG
jgi:hypothetical protein